LGYVQSPNGVLAVIQLIAPLAIVSLISQTGVKVAMQAIALCTIFEARAHLQSPWDEIIHAALGASAVGTDLGGVCAYLDTAGSARLRRVWARPYLGI